MHLKVTSTTSQVRLVKRCITNEAKSYRSQAKTETPHLNSISASTTPGGETIRSSNVLAQQGYCSHVVGLVYALDLAITKARDAEPCTSSCTSLPQQWHKPRGNKIRAVPISTVVVAKATENR
ncbi:hypothetical protein N1851_023104 [Merluccius polli]|uniref:Uncharacterized protein n=1 Tax=Merluccius polli TaxID=89951 RepID=A0AA47MH68_MERPO|nr:hypothetical protein N1851_023104 [Merluccius polli]